MGLYEGGGNLPVPLPERKKIILFLIMSPKKSLHREKKTLAPPGSPGMPLISPTSSLILLGCQYDRVSVTPSGIRIYGSVAVRN